MGTHSGTCADCMSQLYRRLALVCTAARNVDPGATIDEQLAEHTPSGNGLPRPSSANRLAEPEAGPRGMGLGLAGGLVVVGATAGRRIGCTGIGLKIVLGLMIGREDSGIVGALRPGACRAGAGELHEPASVHRSGFD